MTEVEIYSSAFCAYCDQAKALLERKGVAFTEIDVSMNAEKAREMIERTGGRRSVPQIFVGGKYVGDFQTLYALDREGKLDELLGIAA
jgi:glutaredoxin 3